MAASSTATRQSRTRQERQKQRARNPGRSVSPDPVVEHRPGSVFGLVLACFVLSGFAALLYETAWLRQFSIVFGTSELAVAAVLGAYMAGLAFGAAAAGRFVSRVRRPVLWYGLLELGIAAGALAVPIGMVWVRRAQIVWMGGQPEPPDAGGVPQTLFYVACTFFVLLVPTGCMGATLPMLARHVIRRSEDVGRRIGWLYAANTLGAVIGTLAAAFVLLPRLGLQGTVWVGVIFNAFVFVLAVLLDRISNIHGSAVANGDGTTPGRAIQSTSDDRPPHTITRRIHSPASEPLERSNARSPQRPFDHAARWLLPLMLVSGATSFTYEVLWTRLLGHILGGSLYAFATMLAGFLTGITLGSAAATRFSRTRSGAAMGLAAAQLGTGALAFGVSHLFDVLPQCARWLDAGEHAGLAANAGLAMLVLLPATVCIGATLPLAVRALARDETDVAATTARIYAWNTIGCIAGAVLAGMVLLPWLGYGGTASGAIGVNLGLAAWAACLTDRRRPILIAGTLAALLLVAFPPRTPESVLLTSPFTDLPAEGRVVYSSVGRSASVLLLENNGTFLLRTNGLPEAGIAPRGAPPGGRYLHRWLSALPVLARPETKSMLIVGFGGGIAVEGVPPTVETIDAVELEPEVIAANRAIAERRLRDPLSDPRLRIVLNDARGTLALTTKRYDAIVSQPSHPWTAGASHLYTREFMQLARDHLNEGGVFLQWMNASFVDEALFKSIGATLLDVFAHVRLYRPNPKMLLFVASAEPLDVEAQLLATGAPLNSAAQSYEWLGVNNVNDVAAALALESDELARLCGGHPVNTDDHNRLASGATECLGGQAGFDLDHLFTAHDPLLKPDSRLAALHGHLDRVQVARRLAVMGMLHRADRVADAITDPSDRLLARGLVRALNGERDTARKLYREALRLDPDNHEARFLVIEPHLTQIAAGRADPQVAALAAALPDPAAAVVEGWRSLQRNDIHGLAQLDERLAQATAADVCFPLASCLRAMWRSKLRLPEPSPERLMGALRHVDRVLATDPNLFAFLVRLNVAASSGQDTLLVETADQTAAYFETAAALVDERVRRATSDQVLQRISRVEATDAISPHRLEQVRQRFHALKQRPSP